MKILSLFGFNSSEAANIAISEENQIYFKELKFGDEITIIFDPTQRYCIGWHDLESGERFACPTSEKVEHKYEQCKSCQSKTGFNPAFYHADSVSQAQQARNSLPHFVYLAYFSDSDIKVGISFAKRGNSRLLEQGARQAIILETFNSALVARQYEADISKMKMFCENVKLNHKLELLSYDFDKNLAKSKLYEAKEVVEANLNTKFENSEYLDLDDNFFAPNLNSSKLKCAIDVTTKNQITGKIVGVLGSILICEYNDELLALPLKKFTGYPIDIINAIGEIELDAQQSSLF